MQRSKEVSNYHKARDKAIVSAITKNASIIVDTDIIFEFYSALQVCIDNKICDEQSGRELMRGAAKLFVSNNCAYIAYKRRNLMIENYGVKAIKFSGSACDVKIYEK